MLRHKNIDRICCLVLVCTLLLTTLFVAFAATGHIEGNTAIGYENRLFDQSRVHTIEIVMDDWDAFLDTCTSEVYSPCTLVIDGEKYANVGIRGKGNTSLSTVASYGNDRYSFKVEFDQYQKGKSYHGLDKISLNNLIADNTYMKDYLCYTMMLDMGVASPLCSYVQINVNGEAWGLYLAVEGVEDAFLRRNYGTDLGELYKPDSMDFGGGVGNGAKFDMNDFITQDDTTEQQGGAATDNGAFAGSSGQSSGAPGGFTPPDGFTMPEGMTPPDGTAMPEGFTVPDSFDPSTIMGGKGNNPFGGMGGDDVKLQYIDDDPDNYSNIFNNAKTDVSAADKARLIAALKLLSEGETETHAITETVDVERVIRYLAVHDFVCNEDSYTGSMVHNYYLYEDDGVLSMIPWDYNLAFGGMGMGGADATSEVNSAIDSPVSGDIASRPMVAWIFASEEYTALYHKIYQEFIDKWFTSGYFTEFIDTTEKLIASYVESDPTAFCTYEAFEIAVGALKTFCEKRAESVSGQLAGTIPSTDAGQSADKTTLVDASDVSINDMGVFSGGGGKGGFGDRTDKRGAQTQPASAATPTTAPESVTTTSAPETAAPSAPPAATDGTAPNGTMPTGDMSNMPNGTMPTGDMSNMPNGTMPTGDMPSIPNGTMPDGTMPPMGDGFDPSAGSSGASSAPDAQINATNAPTIIPTTAPTDAPVVLSDTTAAPSDTAIDANATATVSRDAAAPTADANRAPDQKGDRASGFSGKNGFTPTGGAADNTSEKTVLLFASVAVLLLGVLFAFFYRRNR